MKLTKQDIRSVVAVLAALAAAYVFNYGLWPQFFDLTWDEEVKLHDGRVIVVGVTRTFERFSHFDRWRALDRDTTVEFDTGEPSGRRINRKFERYDVTMIEFAKGNWYFGLQRTTGIPPVKWVDERFPVLILKPDNTTTSATSWDDIPDFPRLNVMPVTPGPEAVAKFSNSRLTWSAKMEHWQKNQRAAGDDGLIIQRHKQGGSK